MLGMDTMLFSYGLGFAFEPPPCREEFSTGRRDMSRGPRRETARRVNSPGRCRE